jgi:hypothetical protein
MTLTLRFHQRQPFYRTESERRLIEEERIVEEERLAQRNDRVFKSQSGLVKTQRWFVKPGEANATSGCPNCYQRLIEACERDIKLS